MKTDHNYQPEDIEALLAEKSFRELYEEEKAFVLEHLASPLEYEQMRETLLSIRGASGEDDSSGTLRTPPHVKSELMAAFEKERKKRALLWWNSIALWFRDALRLDLPAVRLAFGAVAVLLVTWLVFRLNSDEPQTKVLLVKDKIISTGPEYWPTPAPEEPFASPGVKPGMQRWTDAPGSWNQQLPPVEESQQSQSQTPPQNVQDLQEVPPQQEPVVINFTDVPDSIKTNWTWDLGKDSVAKNNIPGTVLNNSEGNVNNSGLHDVLMTNSSGNPVSNSSGNPVVNGNDVAAGGVNSPVVNGGTGVFSDSAQAIVPAVTLSSTTLNCSGTAITLSATGAATYSWTPAYTMSDLTSSKVLTAGTYTVFVTDANGCAADGTVTLNPAGTGSRSLAADKKAVWFFFQLK